MKIQPFGRRIYIKSEEQKTVIKTADGPKIERGEVIAVGPHCDLLVGDKIIFTAWGTDKVNLDGEDYYFLLESDEFILAVLATE